MSQGNQKQAQRFHEPLVAGESPTRTAGCRHRTPNSCSKHSMPSACALVRVDRLCLAPPGSWAKQFERLLTLKNHGVDAR